MGNCVSFRSNTLDYDKPIKTARVLHNTSLTIDHRLPIDDSAFKIQVSAVCSDLLPPWRESKPSDLDISIISGGISNALYKVRLQRAASSPFDDSSLDSDPDCFQTVVVLRVYGDNTEMFVDRDEEVATMRLLHTHGFGPEVLGTFGNGRLESFLTGKVCLQPKQLSDHEFAVSIAQTLARFHLISKGRWNNFDIKRPDVAETPFGRTREWLNVSKTLDYDETQEKMYRGLDVDAILSELRALEITAKSLGSPIAFCHNDLLSGNIMVDPDKGDMTFIDFEYADWAPRGFDLGNHFCEYAGFDCDYAKYPDDAADFIAAYLEVYDGAVPNDQRVQRVLKEANTFALAAHLYWAAWSMLQAKWSSIEFDYMAYAKLRIEEYYKRKESFM
jgi:ethanolamine kinase